MLSVRLPPRDALYPAVEVRPFLAGLLPEDRVKEELARRVGVAADDYVGLLDAYGADCAGAVSVVAEGEAPASSPGQVRWLSKAELADAVAELPRAPLGVGVDPRVRASLGGVQGKLLVVRSGDELGVPLDGAPSTHILKPPAVDASGERWPGIAWLEHWGLALLREAGVDAARSEMFALANGHDALLVERFDRHVDEGGAIVRLHQEDMCQALGVMPADKYQGPGRQVSWRRIAEVLRRVASEPLVEQLALVDRMVASLVVGDADLHAKNVSLRLDPGRVALAPAYDVVPTVVYPDVSPSLALHVSGEVTLTEVRRTSVEDEVVSWGIGSRLARRRVDEVLQRIEMAVPAALAEVDAAPASAKPSLSAAVAHARSALDRLGS
jgi:serine/threonine-protein kinase HipA